MKTIELLEFKTKMLRGKMRIKVVGRSPGITERDIDEIYERIESITVLSPSSMNIMHIYYHHLSSNSSVIARLIPIPSAREMRDLHDMAYVQCLVVSPEALADFGNNPVLLYQTMLSNDAFEAFSTRYMTLKTIESWEKIPPIDVDFIRGLVVGIGRHELMVFLQSILSAASTGFAGQTANLYLLSGTYLFLPMAWRRELTFTVGIPFINERCFRAVGIVPSSLSHVIVNFHKTHYPPCIDFDEVTEGPDYPITDGWASFINQILLDGQYSYIISKLPKVDFPSKENGENYTPTTEEVNRLGLKLLADYMEQRGDVPPVDSSLDQKEAEDTLQVRTDTPEHRDETPMLESDVPYPGHTPSMLPLELPLLQYESGNKIFSPYQRLIALAPQHKDLFLQLDSLVGHVLKYDQAAIETLRRYWKDLHTQLDNSTLWAIREEYIHYVQASLMHDGDEDAEPARKSLSTLEVLDILVN